MGVRKPQEPTAEQVRQAKKPRHLPPPPPMKKVDATLGDVIAANSRLLAELESIKRDNVTLKRLLWIAFDALTDIENDYNDNAAESEHPISRHHKRCVDRAHAAHNAMREAVPNCAELACNPSGE